MGVGNIGCCDKSSAMKVSEISVQSLTNRDSNEAFIFSVLAFLKTDSALVKEYCKYGPESPSKEIDLSKS